jgi:alkaline phosphatase
MGEQDADEVQQTRLTSERIFGLSRILVHYAKLTAVLIPAMLAWTLSGLCASTAPTVRQPPHTAKHLILIIADGMQLEHERAANMYLFGNHSSGLVHWNFSYKGAATTWDVTTYNRYAFAAGKGAFPGDGSVENLSAFNPMLGYDPGRGGSEPYPVDTSGHAAYFGARLKDGTTGRPAYPATDSASAATSLATGYKTDDGSISWRAGSPDNGRLATIAEMYRNQKKGAIGVVSTVPFSHATPAAFVSHNRSRKNLHEIASEIIDSVKPEVVISGGHPLFTSSDPSRHYRFLTSRHYLTIKNSGAYVFAERMKGVNGGDTLASKADEAARTAKKLFGLFGGPEGNFEYHRPTNDGSSLIVRGSEENPTLAEASGAALKVLSRNPNGFFLMIEQGDIDWSNHDNDFSGMIGGIWDLNEAVKAVAAYVDRPGDDITWLNTLLIVTADHANSFMRLSADPARQLTKGRLPNRKENFPGSGYAANVAWYYPDGEVRYGFDGKGVNSHTNEPVTVYATGAMGSLFRNVEGTWYPGARLMDNTQIFRVMLKALGLRDENRRSATRRAASAKPARTPSAAGRRAHRIIPHRDN